MGAHERLLAIKMALPPEREEDVRVVMEPITCDTVDAIFTPTTMVTTESGDSPRPGTSLQSPTADTTPLTNCACSEDGSGGDDDGAAVAGLPHAKQRKRTCSLSVDSIVCDLGTPDPDPVPERLHEGPRLSKPHSLIHHTSFRYNIQPLSKRLATSAGLSRRQ
jgi:hypothetical protein